MTKHRDGLSRVREETHPTDGGLETSLIFHRGMDPPHSAAFPLLDEARSHAQLEESREPDIGDPAEPGRRDGDLRRAFPSIRVRGGCRGTDHRHLIAIYKACEPSLAAE